jgi:hypothetical protein
MDLTFNKDVGGADPIYREMNTASNGASFTLLLHKCNDLINAIIPWEEELGYHGNVLFI